MSALWPQVRAFCDGLAHRSLVTAQLGSAFQAGQQPLVIGVSGGPDSLALLHLLLHTQIWPAEKITVAHLNHQLRAEADAEAAYVAAKVAAWGVSCRLGTAPVAELARQERLSIEDAGRIARYRFLAATAQEVGARLIAVAHNADDQAETILMHFIRGAGLAGLRGMEPVSLLSSELRAPTDPAPLLLLRPLLSVAAGDLRAYCREEGLQPIHDPSNQSPEFQRNRIRHELMPLLATFNPRIQAQLRQNAVIARDDHLFLQAQARQVFADLLLRADDDHICLRREGWSDLPTSLRRYVIRRAVEQLAPASTEVSFKTIEQARHVADSGRVGMRASLPGGLILRMTYDSWILSTPAFRLQPPRPAAGPQLEDGAELALPIPGRLQLANGWTLTARRVIDPDPAAIAANPNPWHAFLDARQVDRLTVRSRRPGDRFQPLGLGGRSTKIKDVMINRKIPAALREKWPLVANGSHLVWLMGHLIDERLAVSPASPAVIQLICEGPKAG